MKALICRAHGPPESLTVEEVPVPQPAPNEVQVRVRAAGINFPDSLIIQNLYQFKPPLPFSPGGEMAGEITAVGADVKDFATGQSVIAFCGWGAFAEYAVVAQDRLMAMPEGMPYEIAGSFFITYGTCYHALKDRAALVADETVLVLGGAGGIGLATIEIAKALGGRVFAAAKTDATLAICRANGGDETINYATEDLRERLKAFTGGRGVDVVCDPVGGAFSELALRSMAWRGRYLVVGFADGQIPRFPLNLLLLKGCAVLGVFWADFLRREPAGAEADLQALATLYRSGRIRPLLSGRYALEETPQALRSLMARQAHGKLVVLP